MSPAPYFPRTSGHEDEPAILWPGGELSWALFEERVLRVAKGLETMGLGPGDRVAVMAGNVPQFIEVVAGCLRAGVMTVPINWHLTMAEVAYILSDSGAAMAFADQANIKTVEQAAVEAEITKVAYEHRVGVIGLQFWV